MLVSFFFIDMLCISKYFSGINIKNELVSLLCLMIGHKFKIYFVLSWAILLFFLLLSWSASLFFFFYSNFELNDNVCYWNVHFLEWISCFISILDSLSICCSSASLLVSCVEFLSF